MKKDRATIDANVWVAAFERRDRFHEQSLALLHKLAADRTELHDPAFVLLEVACAVTRRAGVRDAGRKAAQRLRAHPSMILHPLDDELLAVANKIGTAHSLRAADALYAATAHSFTATLVTWDSELIARTGAVSPADWL